MANDTEKAIDVLTKQIKSAINTVVAKANFTKEYLGIVESVINPKHFKVRFNNASYEIHTKNNLNLKVHDNVHIVVPNNNIHNKYMLEDVIVSSMNLKI